VVKLAVSLSTKGGTEVVVVRVGGVWLTGPRVFSLRFDADFADLQGQVQALQETKKYRRSIGGVRSAMVELEGDDT